MVRAGLLASVPPALALLAAAAAAWVIAGFRSKHRRG